MRQTQPKSETDYYGSHERGVGCGTAVMWRNLRHEGLLNQLFLGKMHSRRAAALLFFQPRKADNASGQGGVLCVGCRFSSRVPVGGGDVRAWVIASRPAVTSSAARGYDRWEGRGRGYVVGVMGAFPRFITSILRQKSLPAPSAIHSLLLGAGAGARLASRVRAAMALASTESNHELSVTFRSRPHKGKGNFQT